MPVQVAPHVSAPPLQYQTHRELVNRAFQFHKRSEDFIRAHDETLSVAAMGVSNSDCLSFTVHH
jgi:hypothetical protein